MPSRARGARSVTLAMVLAAVLVVSPARGEPASGSVPRPDLLARALTAYRQIDASGLVRNRVLTVIDYSLPSRERRLWVLDPKQLRVLFHEFVAHGRGSTTDANPDVATSFGNALASKQSSLGTFLTGHTYIGMHGYSLELIGLEPGVNDNALERRIVIHPADYVSADFRAQNGGRVGRSWGCPALDPAVAATIIDRIQSGSVVFVGGGASRAPETKTGGGA